MNMTNITMMVNVTIGNATIGNLTNTTTGELPAGVETIPSFVEYWLLNSPVMVVFSVIVALIWCILAVMMFSETARDTQQFKSISPATSREEFLAICRQAMKRNVKTDWDNHAALQAAQAAATTAQPPAAGAAAATPPVLAAVAAAAAAAPPAADPGTGVGAMGAPAAAAGGDQLQPVDAQANDGGVAAAAQAGVGEGANQDNGENGENGENGAGGNGNAENDADQLLQQLQLALSMADDPALIEDLMAAIAQHEQQQQQQANAAAAANGAADNPQEQEQQQQMMIANNIIANLLGLPVAPDGTNTGPVDANTFMLNQALPAEQAAATAPNADVVARFFNNFPVHAPTWSWRQFYLAMIILFAAMISIDFVLPAGSWLRFPTILFPLFLLNQAWRTTYFYQAMPRRVAMNNRIATVHFPRSAKSPYSMSLHSTQVRLYPTKSGRWYIGFVPAVPEQLSAETVREIVFPVRPANITRTNLAFSISPYSNEVEVDTEADMLRIGKLYDNYLSGFPPTSQRRILLGRVSLGRPHARHFDYRSTWIGFTSYSGAVVFIASVTVFPLVAAAVSAIVYPNLASGAS